MLTTRLKICWAILFSITILMIQTVDLFAHTGHDDPVTISRGSIVYLRETISPYLLIQEKLAAGSFDDEITKAAMEIKKVMEEAGLKENDPSGKRMFKGVASSPDGTVLVTLHCPGWWILFVTCEQGEIAKDGKTGPAVLQDAVWIYVEPDRVRK